MSSLGSGEETPSSGPFSAGTGPAWLADERRQIAGLAGLDRRVVEVSFILSTPNGISTTASLRARKPAISLDSTGTRATRGA